MKATKDYKKKYIYWGLIIKHVGPENKDVNVLYFPGIRTELLQSESNARERMKL